MCEVGSRTPEGPREKFRSCRGLPGRVQKCPEDFSTYRDFFIPCIPLEERGLASMVVLLLLQIGP